METINLREALKPIYSLGDIYDCNRLYCEVRVSRIMDRIEKLNDAGLPA